MANPVDGPIESGASAARDVNQDAYIASGRDANIGTVNVHYHGSDNTRRPGPVGRLRRGATTFVGRAAQRENLGHWMDYHHNPSPLANILNGPGSGKTTLALRVAQDLAPAYPGGQLFLEFSQVGMPELDAAEALFRLLLQLGVEENRIPDSFAGRVAAFQAELRKPTLLVFDSVTSGGQVEALLPSRDDCGVLMTSRRSFSELEGIREMDLGSMTDDEGLALLEARIGADRIATDPDAARSIVRQCGSLPLALHMAGAQLTRPANRRLPLARFAERLATERLDLLKTDHLDLRASFSLSYRELSPGAARHFRLLGLIAVPDFGDGLAAAVDGGQAWEETLAELLDAHLIEPVGQDRARFHDLVKVFAQERADDEDAAEDRQAAVSRVMTWAVETATRWGRFIGVDGRHAADQAAYSAALVALDVEYEVLMAVVRQSATTGHDDVPWRIVSQLAGYFEVRGRWADWLEAADLAVECSVRLDDPVALGTARHMRSWPLRMNRRLTEAIEEAVAALNLFDTVPGIAVQRADVLSHLGTLYREAHRYEESERCLNEAAEIYRDADDAHGEGLVLRTLGHVQFWRRDLDTAGATLVRAIELLRNAGDQGAEGWSHNNLCAVRGAQWRLSDAAHHHGEALRLFEQIEHPQGRAWAHNHLGNILRQYGRTSEAITHAEQALTVFEEIGDTYGQGWALLYLGAARQDMDRVEIARQVFAEMNVPEDDGMGTALVWLGRLRGDSTLLDQAVRHFEVVGNLQGEGDALRERAELERRAGQADAVRTYEDALACSRRASDPYGEAQALLGLAELDPGAGHGEEAEAILGRLGLPHS